MNLGACSALRVGCQPNAEAAREVVGIPSEAAARRSMACSSGNTARAALIASELCKLCVRLSVHLNDLRIHLSHLSVRLSVHLSDLRIHLSHLSVRLRVHLSDLSDLCLELLHRQHWLNWSHRSCGQRQLLQRAAGLLQRGRAAGLCWDPKLPPS